ncbi:MAG: serine/threonine protein kinase [Deltaproteobacteria bacterium]|nr:serine/threonine protein kinase [Deltaproteobacteria bacterium]
MAEEFPIAFGRYQLVERLAVGGMAELFIGTVAGEHGFAKQVVIKRLLPHLVHEATYNAMFIDEAKLTARLVHPKIAQTYELGRVGENLYIAMEYVDGIDVLAMLRECAHRRQRVPAEVAVWIAHEVLDALEFAHTLREADGHAMGVVHRDISPSNVLLSVRGDVKLVDFGIARASASDRAHHSKSGTLKGKYGYMSPEQVIEQPLDGRSDLFSVGIVLAEMLIGRRLFAAAAELDVLLMVRDAKLTRLDRFGADLDAELVGLLKRALRKNPDERFASAAAFRDALAEWLFEHRHRITPRQVAEVVAELREAARMRRREAMEQARGATTAVLDVADAGPAQQVAAKAVAVEASDAVVQGVYESGESMQMQIIQPDESGPHGATRGGRAPSAPLPPLGASSGRGPTPHTIARGTSGPTNVTGSSTGIAAAGSSPSLSSSPGTLDPLEALEGDREIDFSDLARELDGLDLLGDLAPPEAPTSAPTDDDEDETNEIDLDDAFVPAGLAPGLRPVSRTASASVPSLIEELEASVRYPSIEAAITALAPVESDPAAIDFDDTEVEGASRSRDIRLPTPEELAARPVPPPPVLPEHAEQADDTGDFAVTPPIGVMFRLITARATGMLAVAVGGIKKEIYVRDGLPEFVSSNVASELFGSYLVSQNILSSGELAMALAMMPHYGGKLGDTLVGLGLLRPLEVFRHLTRQVRAKLIDVCSWSKGSFAWFAGRENTREAFPLDLNAFEVLGAGAMAVPPSIIEAWAQRNAGERLRAAKGVRVGPDRFEIEGLRSLYDTLDGRKTIGEVLGRYTDATERMRAARMLVLLAQCELARPVP